MKPAFTMIELIFVIVILGILAAVAIPKLAATRDDATTAALITQMREGMKEFINYYTARGGEVNFSEIPKHKTSQIVFNELINKGWVDVKDDNHSVLYSDKANKTVCINYYTDGVQVEVETNTSNNSSLCKDIRKIIMDRNYSVLKSMVNF